MSAFYKKILVISDNLSLCKDLSVILKEVISSNNYPSTFEFACSKYSDGTKFQQELESTVLTIDLKDEAEVRSLLKYDLILSIHCKQLFPDKLVDSVKCINIHPGYNPVTRGWYPQIFSIIHGIQLGATIHEMTIELDNGPVIDRVEVKVESDDNSLTAYNRVVKAEVELFRKNISLIIENKFDTYIPQEKGNLFLKKDFRALQQIDLNETLTFKQAIDRLRAFTHPPFSNIFFIDEDGKKNFIEIKITRDDS